jgi:aminoglycoside phosphotransferase (APT) family kinase protein
VSDVEGADRTSLEGLVDPVALAAWMDDQDGLPGRGEPLEVRRVSSGASNDIFEVERGGEVLMLRRPPRVGREQSDEIMLREARVLAALNGTPVPHPTFRAVCADPSVLGATFYLMERVEGFTPMRELPEPFRSDPALRREMGFQLVEAAGHLANVDWRAAGLEGFGRPEGFHERQADRWLAHLAGYERLEGYEVRDLPGLHDAADWLRAHPPEHWEPGISHGDYQFANVMFAPEAPARLVAIVDWEMATVGDPLLDLAWVINTWKDPDEDGSGAYTQPWSGFPSRAELLERYAAVTGRDLSRMDYYVILAGFKLGILLEGHWARQVAGVNDTGYGEVMRDIAADLIATGGARARGERPCL